MEHWRYYLLGWLLELLGRRESALAEYRTALRIKPDFHRCANRLAYTLGSLERYAEAEPYFLSVLGAEPGNAAAHFNLGFTQDKRGQYAQAVTSFRKATRLSQAPRQG